VSEESPRITNRYQAIIEKIFFSHYVEGEKELSFARDEIATAAKDLQIALPKNLGDVLYAIRYRIPFPNSVLETQTEGMEWIIEGVGRGLYAFRLVRLNRIRPREDLITTLIPDATPEIISSYALDDEQALLAIVRYNRLIDIFLGLTTYSLQNHLRSTVSSGSQVEIDELYVGLDRRGAQYVIPVQAKGGNDQISVVQTRQDMTWCNEKFEGTRCLPVSAQFMSDNRIAMFQLTIEDDFVKVVEERHYRLVPSTELDREAITNYRD